MGAMRRLIPFTIFMVALTACGNDLVTDSAAQVAAPDSAQSRVNRTDVVTSVSTIPPGVPDLSISIVDVNDVHFDTFDGGSVPLGEASEGQVLDLLDQIPPIDNPPYIDPAEDEWLEDDDIILGYIDAEGQAYAYPHKILNFHEIVNDTLADVPVLVSYCPLCNSGVVFDRRIDDLRQEGELTFGNSSALFDNDLVMVDRQTNTYWWQVPGRGIVGSLSGAELTVLPSVTTTWSQWLIDEPDTLLISRDLGFRRDYTRDPFAGYSDRVNQGITPFPVEDGVFDDVRLAPAAQVIAIEVGSEAVAIPIDQLTEDFELSIGGVDHVIVPDGGGGARAFTISDDGQQVPTASRSTFWFAYFASFPDARVVRPPR